MFVKDSLQIRKTADFESKVHFGLLHVVKELVNTTSDGEMDLGLCVSEWDVRTLQRQWLCPGEGNPNGEGLISAHIFGFNQTYPGGGRYYNPQLGNWPTASARFGDYKVRFLTEIVDDFRRFVDEIWRF